MKCVSFSFLFKPSTFLSSVLAKVSCELVGDGDNESRRVSEMRIVRVLAMVMELGDGDGD